MSEEKSEFNEELFYWVKPIENERHQPGKVIYLNKKPHFKLLDGSVVSVRMVVEYKEITPDMG